MGKRLSLFALLVSLILCGAPARQHAQRAVGDNNLAPGAPGKDAQWPSAGKQAVGTSNTLESKVWFTLRDGVMDEVYYPTVDVANTQSLQLIVVGGKVETESEDTTHKIEVLDPQALTFRQTNTAKSGYYTITKTYVTDPQTNTVLIDVQFESRTACDVYVYYDPSLNNSGMHDSAWTQGEALLASDADKSSALLSSSGFADVDEKMRSFMGGKKTGEGKLASNGYLGTSDGLTDLKKNWNDKDLTPYVRAADGNVVQVAALRGFQGSRSGTDKRGRPVPVIPRTTLALGFGKEPDDALRNARSALAKGFTKARAEYEQGWHEYVRTLRRVDAKHQAQYDMAAMVLKAHEDKTYRGAMIASLSVPWGGGSNANEPNVGGYHLVWSRDLYQVATAFYALGDKASADRALDYLFRVQQKADGSFPQNSWLDGRPFWGSLQLDEVAYPLVLAYQLGRTDNETWTKHVRPAADFIVKYGPFTPQERWEEKSGYSPLTIAAEIAGLVCAAEIARRNGDEASANIYLATADDFARNVERWTATTTGVYGDKNYYLRLSFNDDPNDGAPFNVGNGGGEYDERAIVDAGFLELVRLGVRPPQDALIAKSLAVTDQVIKVETPNGASFYRYNHDGYGEMDDGRSWNWDGKYTGTGRLWALLAGERGEYELARGMKTEAARRLDAMAGFANEGGMIPEQIWDKRESPRPEFKFGEGTGSATPLAWSMAQFIRLATNLQEGRNIETPDIVAARYAKITPPPRANADFGFPAGEALERMQAGTTFNVGGGIRAASGRAFALIGDERRELARDAQGNFTLDVPVARGLTPVVVVAISQSGATYFRREFVRGLTAEEKEKAERDSIKTDWVERVKNAKTAPLVEGEDVTFIYRGDAKRVELAGDFTGWSPAGLVLQDVPGAKVKALRLKFPKGARLEYKLIADGEWILDPLNPNRNNNGVGGLNSNFTGPDYRPAPFATGRDELRGKLEKMELAGDAKRKLQVYLPPGYAQGDRRYPVLYEQDGTEAIELGRVAEIADRMISDGKVEPFIIVFIDPIERMKEYWADDKFADWMARNLVPAVDARYRTRAERDSRALSGASLGGTISTWTALRHPDVFARVAGQSSAFQIDEERVVAALARLDDDTRQRNPMRFYFDAGQYEPLILDVNRRVNVILRARGYPVIYRESASGHNFTTWRDRLADVYMTLWEK
jgi:glucoamylase